jgi:HlyD family secretion protein/Biotin-lipoyl like
VPGPADTILELVRRARGASSAAALRFIAVNDTHLLSPYQQAALWFSATGVGALSGVLEIEANAPYVQWLGRVTKQLDGSPARAFTLEDLSAELAQQWSEWLPAHALWVPFAFPGEKQGGGLIFARDQPWQPLELAVFKEWIPTWAHFYAAAARPGWGTHLLATLRRMPRAAWKRKLVFGGVVALAAFCPVRLSVLAPGELVPANPAVVRAPLDGVIKSVLVQSNTAVRAGDPLIAYDDLAFASKLEVATQALRTAETEERQYAQQAMSDPKARAALSAAQGAVEEKRLEMEFLKEQLERNRILAPRDGIVFLDDASDWVGRTITAGQRILRLADPEDREIEVWLPIADAIDVPQKAGVKLYLSATPLDPVQGEVRFVAYEAVRRPDGQYAYRLRARLVGETRHRVGLKGTARVTGKWIPACYWMLRRPLAALRERFGV